MVSNIKYIAVMVIVALLTACTTESPPRPAGEVVCKRTMPGEVKCDRYQTGRPGRPYPPHY